MRKVAIFDIDGTIFRSSLLIELVDTLIQSDLFPSEAEKMYARAHRDWLDRKGPYEEYIGAVIHTYRMYIRGVRRADFSRIARRVIAIHQNRTYRYTRDLVKTLKKKRYYLLAISHSPEDIVQVFCKKLGFHKVYGRVYEVGRNGRFTGKLFYEDLISNKAKIVERAVAKERLTLKGSVGVGDTESDIPFLKMVERPVCFNPNRRLYRYAKRADWRVVVERKDMVYHL